jgi:hypothetical protein
MQVDERCAVSLAGLRCLTVKFHASSFNEVHLKSRRCWTVTEGCQRLPASGDGRKGAGLVLVCRDGTRKGIRLN